MKDVPPPPSGWNKSPADLLSEMKSGVRAYTGRQEAEGARNYERTVLLVTAERL